MPGGTGIFILTIEDAGEGNFDVYAQGAKDEASRLTFIPDEDFQNLIRMLHERGGLGFLNFPAQERACTSIGEHLFETFFVGPVLQRYRDYRQGSEPRIALQIPPSLFYLPWEVIRDPQEDYGQFLSMQGSVIRCDLNSQPESTLYVDSPESSTYLFLLASVQERPLSHYEPVDEEFVNFLKVDPATYINFGIRLKKVQPFGLVFFGHGNVQSAQGYLVFLREQRRRWSKHYISDPIAGYAVGRDVSPVKNMRIAYIFACESAWAERSTSFENSIAGSLLLRTGLPYVVGAQTPIDFFAAQKFFEGTLAGIADGYPLDLALSEGRKRVQEMDPNDAVRPFSYKDWWVPVLYAKTTDFDLLPKREAIPILSEQSTDESAGSASSFFGAAANSLGRLFSDDESTKDLLGPRS